MSKRKREIAGRGEGASVVQVVVAVHHQCLEEESEGGTQRNWKTKRRKQLASCCSVAMPAKGNLPANIQKTGLKKDTTGGEPQDCGRCGSWHSRQGDEANPQGQPAHYKVRERSGDWLLLFFHSSTNYHPSVTTFSPPSLSHLLVSHALRTIPRRFLSLFMFSLVNSFWHSCVIIWALLAEAVWCSGRRGGPSSGRCTATGEMNENRLD